LIGVVASFVSESGRAIRELNLNVLRLHKLNVGVQTTRVLRSRLKAARRSALESNGVVHRTICEKVKIDSVD